MLVLQLLDVASTGYGMHLGASEGNPMMASYIHAGGVWAHAALKVAGTVFIWNLAGLLPMLHRNGEKLGKIALQSLCALMVAVLGWNAWLILLHV